VTVAQANAANARRRAAAALRNGNAGLAHLCDQEALEWDKIHSMRMEQLRVGVPALRAYKERLQEIIDIVERGGAQSSPAAPSEAAHAAAADETT
jgi:hypothetical protein